MDELNIGMEVTAREPLNDIYKREDYKKLDFNASQRIQLAGLFQQIPAMAATSILNSAFTVKFPEGISGTLMAYKNGGSGTPIIGEDGRSVAHASLERLEKQAAVLGAFNLMAVASGQYFLSEINSELRALNQGVDKILEFLYSDKKAELMAEVSFAQYAYHNYNSIMSYDEQRIATIGSLQKAKKVAMKDIEFYMSDLVEVSNPKDNDNPISIVDKAFQIKSCLELSMQLYVMSTILEMYYSQNRDANYINFIEKEAIVYLGKCEKRMLSSFSMMSNYIHNFKVNPLKKIDKAFLEDKIGAVLDSFTDGKEPGICRSFRKALQGMKKEPEFYIDDKKVIYLKTA